LSIHGNVHADKLTRLALQQKEPLHKNTAVVRKEILIQSAQLITNIDKLLTNNPHIFTSGGPSDSSDDFVLTDVTRNTLLEFRDIVFGGSPRRKKVLSLSSLSLLNMW
jgi:GTPase Era involved in 16S rRNA processing